MILPICLYETIHECTEMFAGLPETIRYQKQFSNSRYSTYKKLFKQHYLWVNFLNFNPWLWKSFNSDDSNIFEYDNNKSNTKTLGIVLVTFYCDDLQDYFVIANNG